MAPDYDLIVIGTGSAGSGAAHRCRSAGWKVAIVDSRPFGGTCALRGCDPKKVLVGASEVIDRACRMAGKGITADGLRIDWPALMEFKRSFTDPVPEEREKDLAEAGIAAFHGRARFVGPTAIQVGSDRLHARHLLIAAGAAPARLNIPGEEFLTSSDAFLELASLPPRVLFIGGGYISFEFAHVAARAGAEVRILHRTGRVLPAFDSDLVASLVEVTRAIGVDLRLDSPVSRISRTDRGLVAHSEDGQAFEAELVVHGAGRVPDIEDMDLDRGGVRREKQGVTVNEYLQSVSNPAIYAAGDCVSLPVPRLTPVSSLEGEVAADNLLKGNHRTPDLAVVPSIVYTTPPLAAVGLQESAARDNGIRFRTSFQDTTAWYSSRRIGVRKSAAKILIDDSTDQVIGAHILGPHAEELINLLAMAIRFRLPVEELKQMIFAYPTGASDLSYLL